MKTVEYLGQVNRMNLVISNKLEEIKQLDELIHSAGAINYDKVNVQTSSDKDIVGKSVVRLMEMIDENDELIGNYLARKKLITKQISNMPNDYRYNILYGRFILGKTIEKIAGEIPCSVSTVKKSLNRSMDLFEEMYGSTYLDKEFDLYEKKSR